MKKTKILFAAIILLTSVLSIESQDVFTFCTKVDDKVNPVDALSETFSGSLVYFHLSMVNPIGKEGDNNITVGWIIHTVGEDGMDSGFINEYFTYFPSGNRRFCTDEPYCFTQPGKYRVYAINWDDRQVNHHTGNLLKYYAKNEITVK